MRTSASVASLTSAPNEWKLVGKTCSGVESAQTGFYFFDDQLVQYGYPED